MVGIHILPSFTLLFNFPFKYLLTRAAGRLHRYSAYAQLMPSLHQSLADVPLENVTMKERILSIGTERQRLFDEDMRATGAVQEGNSTAVVHRSDALTEELSCITQTALTRKDGSTSEDLERDRNILQKVLVEMWVSFGCAIFLFIVLLTCVWYIATKQARARNDALEQALRVAEESAQMKTNWLNSVSHELRTPSK